jgi:hypothetical protein
MKPYFSKLLTEQERAGGNRRSKKTGGRVRYVPDPEHDYEDEVTRLPISRRRQYGYDYRCQTDVLSPLRGVLAKNAGRLWDHIYSELCAALDRRSVSGLHVFQHLWDFVEKNAFVGDDGKVWYYPRWTHNGAEPIHKSYRTFYIHPTSGCLLTVPEEPAAKPKPAAPVERLDIDGHRRYEKINDVWYFVEVAKLDKAAYRERWRLWGHNPWDISEREVILRKRQLSKKELKKIIAPALEKVVA